MGPERASIVRWALAGFLLGAAVLAGGGDDPDLEARLKELQDLAARARAAVLRPELHPRTPETGRELGYFPLADLLAGVPDWSRPDLNAYTGESALFGGVIQDAPQPFGTLDEVAEMVRAAVAPDSWFISQYSNLLVLERPVVLEKVRGFLDARLRPAAHRSVCIESEVWEVDAGHSQSVDRAALAEGGGRRLFAGRVLALARQKVLLWHGRQAALMTDTDVEVAGGVRVPDPLVRIVFGGGTLHGRVLAGDRPDRVRLELTCVHEELERPVPTRVTREAGEIHLPVLDRLRTAVTLNAPSGAWATAATSDRGEAGRRVLTVRATLLERGGGRR